MTQEELLLKPPMRVHLIGVGGAGLSAIAWVLLERGFTLSGSDMQANEATAALAERGATIYRGHAAEQAQGVDLVAVSSAVAADNVEVTAAQAAGIPVWKRADLLGALMAESVGIAVAGSHGKTTTTAMIAHILLEAGLDPTIILGGVLPAIGRNGRAGQGPHFVVEADEYDHMFLGLRPWLAVITNVEYDHPDLFPTWESYQAAFRQFAALLPEDGRLVVCADDEGVRQLVAESRLPEESIESYGLDKAAWQAVDLRVNQLGGVDFLALHQEQPAGLIRLRIPGEHNSRNALAAVAATTALGVEFNVIRQALAGFGGVGRRFQVTGEVGGVTIIDDYAHHPTEIRVTLAAARQQFPGRRIWAVWQPHTYSRTRALLADFAASFDQADRVVALDIYKSREKDSLGVNTGSVLAQMNHPQAIHVGQIDDAAAYILDRLQPGDVVLTLGAGDGNLVGEGILTGLTNRLNNRTR